MSFVVTCSLIKASTSSLLEGMDLTFGLKSSWVSLPKARDARGRRGREALIATDERWTLGTKFNLREGLTLFTIRRFISPKLKRNAVNQAHEEVRQSPSEACEVHLQHWIKLNVISQLLVAMVNAQ
jgi:hypothetical protein